MIICRHVWIQDLVYEGKSSECAAPGIEFCIREKAVSFEVEYTRHARDALHDIVSGEAATRNGSFGNVH